MRYEGDRWLYIFVTRIVYMACLLRTCTAFGAQSVGLVGHALEMIPTCLLLHVFPFV